MFKQEFMPKLNWFNTFRVLVDLGYAGFDENYTTKKLFIPYKKPRKSKKNPNPQLTKKQKKYNRNMSKKRVIVENVIGGIKRFRCVSDRYRNHNIELSNLFILLAAGLWNFHIKTRN